MRLHALSRTTAFGALAVSVGMAGLLPAAGAAPQAAAGAAGAGMPAALRLAVDAVGGAAALRGLRSFRYRTEAQRWILDEGVRPGGPARASAAVQSRVRYVLPDRLRVDAVRNDRRVHEVLAGRRGFIRGVDANGSSPGIKPMPSDRWAAIREEQRLLNPQVLLKRALRNPRMASNGGTRRIGGKSFRTVVLRDPVAPIRLFVAPSGRLARLRTTQHDYLRRDVLVEVAYRRWTGGSGVRFPRAVTLRSDGERLIRETRSGVRVNPRVRRQVFAFPDNLGRAPHRPRLAAIGKRTSQWLLAFANLGFIKDGGQTAINPIEITDGNNTAEGVTLLGGVANNSVVVEREQGIVVFEGALHDHRAEAVIRYIRRNFAGLPITHVMTTHHHADHASGQRPYVALGAKAVVHRNAAAFFRRAFRERGSTVLPDRLDRSDRRAQVQAVRPGGRTFPGSPTIEVYPLRTEHSNDMVVPFVVDEGVIFVSDIYTPGAPPGDGAVALDNLIENQNLAVEWIVGGHGGFISFEDFQAALGGQ